MSRPRTLLPRRAPALRPVAVAALHAALVLPLAPASAQSLTVERSIGLTQTITNNTGLSASDHRTDSVTEVSPGISATGRSGRSAGSLDYRLDAVAYARDSSRNELRNNLSADGRTELVDNHVFLNASANVSQQSISAFGQQAGGTGLDNGNTSEVATLSVSPSARARLAGLIDLGASANWRTTRSGGTALGDSTGWDTSVRAGATHGIFGWSVAATRENSDYDGGSRLVNDSLVGSLSVAPTSRLRLSARGGRERTDTDRVARAQETTTSGWGLNWQPTPRTQVGFDSDDRYFGRSHSFSLTHRFHRAMLTYGDSRGVSGESNQNLGPLRQGYQSLFRTCMAAANNDAALCNKLLLERFPELSFGLLSSAPSLQRSQSLVLVVSGQRQSLSLAATRSQNDRLDEFEYAAGDLSRSPRVRQEGLTFGATHRLTPQASLLLTLSLQRTLDEPGLAGNDQQRVEVGYSSSFGPRTTGALSVRHVRFDSETSPYRESALIGSLNHRF